MTASENLQNLHACIAKSRDRWKKVLGKASPLKAPARHQETVPEREDFEADFRNQCDTFLRYEWAAGELKTRLPSGGLLLEIGCGYGLGTCLLSSLGYDVLGIDSSSAAIATALERYPWLNFQEDSTENFGVPESCNAIVALEVLEHIQDYPSAIAHWKRLLKPGGILLVSTPHRYYNKENSFAPINDFHLKEFAPEELRLLFPGCQLRGTSLRVFQSRFHNIGLRATFFILANLLTLFDWKSLSISGAQNFKRRDLIYGRLGWFFPNWSGGLLMTWVKPDKI